MPKVPLLLVGDLPGFPSGLSRILGDLATRIQEFIPEVDVATCGYAPWANLGASGVAVPAWGDREYPGYPSPGLRRWAFNDVRDWGASAMNRAYRRYFGDRKGILFSIWDPARCHALLPLKSALPVQMWGYFAVDGENIHGTISGPAAEAVRGYDRVLAYNAYGAKVLAPITRPEQAEAFTYTITKEPLRLAPGQEIRIPEGDLQSIGIRHLPHGIDTDVFCPRPATRTGFLGVFRDIPISRQIVGCVATNQSRKDWGMVFGALRRLVEGGLDVHLWAHVDRLVAEAWSLPQLQEDFGLEDRVTYTLELEDSELARCYSQCAVTIAPGRGEGHGYPIVESLCCGTPVVHADYAGGRDILVGTVGGVLVPPKTFHLVGPYAIKRPLLGLGRVAEACRIAMGSPVRREAALTRGETYDWDQVWPQWADWIRAGLERGA